MPIEVTLAKLSPTMESGQLVKWNVKVGDKVKEGDTLAEVQTDKAVMPMESFEEGVVAHLDVQEGDEIALGQRVLVLARKGEDPAEVARSVAGSAGSASGSKAAAGSKPAAASEPAQPSGSSDTNGQEPESVASESAVAATGRIKASPLARRIARSAGVDLSQIRGTGPGGRIVRDDVEAFLKSGGSQAEAPRPAAAAPAPRRGGSDGQTRRVPHSRMRQTIAQRMQQAKQTAPEIHLTIDVRLDRVMSLREALNKNLASEGVKLSVGDFITKAVAVALRRHPALNASYEADAIVEHGEVNIGIAVALEGGLIVPVLHAADRLSLREIRQGTEALATAARQNKLTPKQMMGATFTISNLGMYGIKQFDAILNLPEVGILAVGAAEQRPVVQDGQLAVGWVMTATLTADHRAVDGATAAEFLRTLKSLLEEPALMLA
ncbi:MAG: acetyltransferase component of pyruvate dehydrogenase complex [Isosphaeraceae bacterium]|jgi:pyruvate dehydrogenase E2 component (dihydrolipoamide acetyltransferase)|nr:MAG: acetyltransferase component of pyruvate dehydrogenase complex [Isosphaeraceae bacterium]